MNKPRICAVIINNDYKTVKAVEPLVDLFEVRIDIIGEGWQDLVRKLDKPWIATNRTVEEGGHWQGTEARRIEALLLAMQLKAAFVDIEFRTKNLENIVPLVKKQTKCILSFHDMQKTPPFEELKNIVNQQIKSGADICKIVTIARQFEDNLTVLRLVSEFRDNRIVSFAMGPEGQTSRIMSLLAGADFAYASMERGKESAPGQITVKEMTQIYGMIFP